MGKDKRQKLWYTAKQLETTNLKKTGAEEMTAEKLFEHQGAILLAQSDGCAVWQFRNETGDGTMTTYEVFPGVMLAFNDFHMEHYECDFVANRRMLAIDHCREGRMEYPAGDNLVAYTAAGDTSPINSPPSSRSSTRTSSRPTSSPRRATPVPLPPRTARPWPKRRTSWALNWSSTSRRTTRLSPVTSPMSRPVPTMRTL